MSAIVLEAGACAVCSAAMVRRVVETRGTGMSGAVDRRVVTVCPACERREAWEARCGSVPGRYAWARLDAPEMPLRVGAVALRAAVASPVAEQLIFTGPSGSGKTSLAAALFRAAMRPSDASGLFALSWRLGACRATWPLGKGDPPALVAAMSARLLVLDDVGSEPPGATNPVAEVIFERHAEALPTWITTALTVETAAARYGEGIARRMFEGAAVLDCGAQ